MEGRDIGENVCLILDIMSYTDKKNMPGVVLFIDFRKAFDTIVNGISFSTPLKSLISDLTLKNLGKNLLQQRYTSYVLNNGHTSEFFALERGVRQGCPLSGLQFVIGIEIFADAIRNMNAINEIN